MGRNLLSWFHFESSINHDWLAKNSLRHQIVKLGLTIDLKHNELPLGEFMKLTRPNCKLMFFLAFLMPRMMLAKFFCVEKNKRGQKTPIEAGEKGMNRFCVRDDNMLHSHDNHKFSLRKNRKFGSRNKIEWQTISREWSTLESDREACSTQLAINQQKKSPKKNINYVTASESETFRFFHYIEQMIFENHSRCEIHLLLEHTWGEESTTSYWWISGFYFHKETVRKHNSRWKCSLCKSVTWNQILVAFYLLPIRFYLLGLLQASAIWEWRIVIWELGVRWIERW